MLKIHYNYPDDDCIIVKTLMLNHNEIIQNSHYFVLYQISTNLKI